jgi:hypothetical protein
MADPVCPRLSEMAAKAVSKAKGKVAVGATYLAMEGPQFSTRAESRMYRQWGADVIGMTAMPEAKLAREAELPYALVGMVTDYDCWREGEAVDVAQVIEQMQANGALARAMVTNFIAALPKTREPSPIDTALDDALYVQKGARIDWVDMYDGDIFDGEILDVSGSVYSTSERFTPKDGVEYWVYVTDNDGNTSNSVRAYPRGGGNLFGFTASGLTGVYLPSGGQQLGSRYVIASNSDLDASTFILDGRGRPNENRECEITLIEYNRAMYEMDGGETPSTGYYVAPGYVLPGYVEVR